MARPGTFQPGNCANPGGRPKGLAAKVREATRDGAAVVEFMLRVFHGRAGKTFRAADRIEAAKWLADRGWGKAAQPMTGEEGEGPVKALVEVRWIGDEPGDG